MNRIDRLFGMLTFLQAKKYVTAEQLAERYEISVRTVYRDIKALGEQGIPVGFEPNRGYYVMREYFLPPVSFTMEEANAFLLMETMVNGFTDRSIQHHYRNAMNKIKAVLKPAQKDALERLSANIALQVPPCVINDNEFITTLQHAIAEHKIVVLDYQNSKGDLSKRKVEPIGLVFYALYWHIIAWCHLRQEYRDFKVNRIKSVAATDQAFTRTDHTTLQEYMKLLPVNY